MKPRGKLQVRGCLERDALLKERLQLVCFLPLRQGLSQCCFIHFIPCLLSARYSRPAQEKDGEGLVFTALCSEVGNVGSAFSG